MLFLALARPRRWHGSRRFRVFETGLLAVCGGGVVPLAARYLGHGRRRCRSSSHPPSPARRRAARPPAPVRLDRCGDWSRRWPSSAGFRVMACRTTRCSRRRWSKTCPSSAVHADPGKGLRRASVQRLQLGWVSHLGAAHARQHRRPRRLLWGQGHRPLQWHLEPGSRTGRPIRN